MIKIFWEIYDVPEYKKKHIRFLIPVILPTSLIIQASGFQSGNKRMGSARSKFLRPLLIDLGVPDDGTNLDSLPNFTITEEEFIRWLSKIRVHQVRELGDMGWLMRIKEEYEKKNKRIT